MMQTNTFKINLKKYSFFFAFLYNLKPRELRETSERCSICSNWVSYHYWLDVSNYILLIFQFQLGGGKWGTFDPYPDHPKDVYPRFNPNVFRQSKPGEKVFVPPTGPKTCPVNSVVDQMVTKLVIIPVSLHNPAIFS